jgi:hypothetical protein
MPQNLVDICGCPPSKESSQLRRYSGSNCRLKFSRPLPGVRVWTKELLLSGLKIATWIVRQNKLSAVKVWYS